MGGHINIGSVIAERRRAAGVTQDVLARHLGVTKAAVSKWELGLSVPDVTLLPRIAAYFSLSLDELFGYQAELPESEAAALYAELAAEGERDRASAHDRLTRAAREHYADAQLLVMLASLLTVWADGSPAPVGDDVPTPDDAPAPGELRAEALELLDRALQITSDPALVFAARQAKATALFQAGEAEAAAELLEPLVKRQDAAAVTMLLASCYRRLGRGDEAWELLQLHRLRAATFLLSALLQEVGTTDDAAYARAAGAAARGVFGALGMAAVNPSYPSTLSFELAESYLRLGEKDAALDELGRAVDELAGLTSVAPDAAASPLFDRLADRLDPERVGEAWAAHKQGRAERLLGLLRLGAAEHVTGPSWAEFADDARYQDICRRVRELG